MSHWNHRIVRRVFEATLTGFDDEVRFGVHEAYYDDNGKVWAITEEPIRVYGESLEDMQELLDWIQKAMKHPILEYDSVPEDGATIP